MTLLRKTYLYILIFPYFLCYLGAASNQLVLIANHDTFPVLMRGAAATRIMPLGYDDEGHVLMTKDTHLNALGDIFDFHDGWESVGDLLLTAGLKLQDICFWVWMTLVLTTLTSRNTESTMSEDDQPENGNNWRI